MKVRWHLGCLVLLLICFIAVPAMAGGQPEESQPTGEGEQEAGATEELECQDFRILPDEYPSDDLDVYREDGRIQSFRGVTVEVNEEAYRQGVQAAFRTEFRFCGEMIFADVSGGLSVDPKRLRPLVNLDIWWQADERRPVDELPQDRLKPDEAASDDSGRIPYATVTINLERVVEALEEFELNEDAQLFLELQPGVLFSAEAAEQIGVIKASQENGGEDDTTIAFDVFRWRVDDLMFYINEE